jgi:2,3-bisphosphoglycerate-dependent phosphoglycerate mutase
MMKKILLGIILGLISLNLISQEISTYYLIRHAEKERNVDKNPPLTNIGSLRAESWAEILHDIKFDAVYSTDYKRTKATAKPTALKNNLDLILYHPRNIDIEKFKKETVGKTVLIVGHSNTIPGFVNQLIGEKKYPQIEDDNNGNLYIVELGESFKIDQLLHFK